MKLSYVIPSHNCAAWLPHAVLSVRMQNYKEEDIEIVIVNDASTDSTKEYLNWLEKDDKRVKVIHNETNQGRSASRNLGNWAATGEAILVLDADDIAYPNRSKLTSDKLLRAEYVYGSAEVMGPYGQQIGFLSADAFNLEKAIEKRTNGIVHSTVGYTKAFAVKCPYEGGDIDRLGIDDWAQQLKAFTAGVRPDFIVPPIAAYRILKGSISGTRSSREVEEAKTKFLDGLKTVTL